MKSIIITGAGSGIGYDMVRLLCEQPNHQILAIARDTAALQLFVQNKEGDSLSNLHVFKCDVENPQEIDELIHSIKEKFSCINYLVNNAGSLINKSFEQLTQKEFLKMYQVNVFSVIQIIQGLLPILTNAHIVNISSIGGVQGAAKFSGLSGYSSSKAALAVLSECLAEELKSKGIHVNCLALGAVQTKMLQAAFPNYIAPVTSLQMAAYIIDFTLTSANLFNGKIIPVGVTTP